jgi:DNA uptake protein ComE-like DNA-binding protein
MVLAAMMVLAFVFPYIYNALRGPAVYPADAEFLNSINALFMADDSTGKDSGRFVSIIPVRGNDTSSQKLQSAGVNESQPYVNIIEINSADTGGLMQIRGIGEVLSRRIIRYRDILGGYSDLQQLLEVYGIDEERHSQILPYLKADTVSILKIDVNSDEFSVILRHPYLDFQQVSQLFRLREKQLITSPRDLLQLPAFSETDIEKLRPYLSF